MPDSVYKIAVNLTANTTELIRAIEGLVGGFKDLDKIVKDVQRSIGQLSGIGGEELTRAFSGAVREASSLDRITKDIARNQANITKEVAAGGRAQGRAGEAAAIAAARSGRHDNTMGLMALGMGGAAELRFAKSAFQSAAEVEQIHANLGMNEPVGEDRLNDLRRLEQRLVREVPGTTTKQIAKVAQEIFTATGDWEDTLKTLPQFSRLAYILENGPGKHHGDPAFAAAQFTEITQRAIDPKTKTINAEQFNKDAEAMMRVYLGTGGRVDPIAYNAMARQARVAGITANDEFLFRDLPAMMVSLPGTRAGTALQALSREFVTGRGTKQMFLQAEHYGLVREGAAWKGGRLLHPEQDVPGYQVLQQNPAQWARDFVLPALQRAGVNIEDKRAVASVAAKVSGTPTVQTALDEFLLGQPAIAKEGAKIKNIVADPMKQLQEHDPTQRVREFTAAWNELLTILGAAFMGPATAMIKDLTSGLHSIADWARANPDAAKKLMEVATGLGVLSVGLSSLGFALQGARAVLAMAGFAGAGGAAGGVGAAAGIGAGPIISGTLGLAGVAGVAGSMDAPTLDDYARQLGSWGGGAGTWHKSVTAPPTAGGPRVNAGPLDVRVINGRDLANGVSSHIADQASRPPSGTTRVDPRISPVYSGIQLGP